LGKQFTLTAADQHQLGAYRADPAGAAKGSLVVIQEIFGVNNHIRAVCDRVASEGYRALAPALFDRTQKDFQCGYTPDEIAEARKFVANPDWGAMLRDTDAAIKELKKEGGPVGIIGFCMGGSIAFLAAAKLDGLAASICYYGGGIAKNADEKPKCPTQMHFGKYSREIGLSCTCARRRQHCLDTSLQKPATAERLETDMENLVPMPEPFEQPVHVAFIRAGHTPESRFSFQQVEWAFVALACEHRRGHADRCCSPEVVLRHRGSTGAVDRLHDRRHGRVDAGHSQGVRCPHPIQP
jgi:carboxymethylenebutenolidase